MNFRICKIILMALSYLFIMVGCGVRESKPKSDPQPKSESTETEIISCKIIFNNKGGEVQIEVKPTKQSKGLNSYSCQMTCPAYFASKAMSANAGELIIHSCDSLFVKKTVPTITRDRFKDYHGASDPKITFHIYTNKGWIEKSFWYARIQDKYSYHYSECFTNLCNLITSNCSKFLIETYKKNGML